MLLLDRILSRMWSLKKIILLKKKQNLLMKKNLNNNNNNNLIIEVNPIKLGMLKIKLKNKLKKKKKKFMKRKLKKNIKMNKILKLGRDNSNLNIIKMNINLKN